MVISCLILGITLTANLPAVQERMAVQQAEAQLQFIQAKIEAKESVEAAAREYVRIVNQIASARDKAQQVLTDERVAQLMSAAQEARWNAARSIIDEERLRLMMLTARERAKYGSSVSTRSVRTKRGRNE